MITSDQPGWRPSRPNVTLEDALILWDVLTDDERRYAFTNFWEALEAVDAGDMEPIRALAESWPTTVLWEKVQPGAHAMARELKAHGPVPKEELVDVDVVIALLRGQNPRSSSSDAAGEEER